MVRSKNIRVGVLIAVFAFSIFGTVHSLSAASFTIGQRVETTSSLRVRSTPGGAVLAIKKNHAQGTIVGGPEIAGTYTWFEIVYDSSADNSSVPPVHGWSAGDFLTEISPESPAEVSAPVSVPRHALAVTAKDGQLNPQGFSKFTNEPLTLVITAVDQDYIFDIPDADLHYTISQGTTVRVPLDGLAEGFYPYACGAQCEGGVVSVITPVED